ncbi:hypothetical protein LZ30DRAFT_743966, partial [Colletotrichum cereale]
METIDLTGEDRNDIAAEPLYIVIDLTQDDEIPYSPAGASPSRSTAAPVGIVSTSASSRGLQCSDCRSLFSTEDEVFEY